jgi:hypothetical protein
MSLQKYLEKVSDVLLFPSHSDYLDEKYFTNGMIEEYVFVDLQKIKLGVSSVQPRHFNFLVGIKADLIELIYGLHVTGVFNKATSDLKQIASYFEAV